MSPLTIAIRKPQQCSETILVVEDDTVQRQLLLQLLLRQGYTVLEAMDGPAALQLCQQHKGRIHLLITDVVLPRMMSGPELAERLAALHPSLKLLYTSAYADGAMVYHAPWHRDASFLAKPFMPDVLKRKVRELLDS